MGLRRPRFSLEAEDVVDFGGDVDYRSLHLHAQIVEQFRQWKTKNLTRS